MILGSTGGINYKCTGRYNNDIKDDLLVYIGTIKALYIKHILIIDRQYM